MMLGCWSAQQIQPEGNQHQSNKFLFFVWVNNSFVDLWPTSAWLLWLSCVFMEGAQNYLWLCHAWKPISWILSHFKYISLSSSKLSTSIVNWGVMVVPRGHHRNPNYWNIYDFFFWEGTKVKPHFALPDQAMRLFYDDAVLSTHIAVCPWMLVRLLSLSLLRDSA